MLNHLVHIIEYGNNCNDSTYDTITVNLISLIKKGAFHYLTLTELIKK